MIRPIQPVGSHLPVYAPVKTQATHASQPAFGLKTVSFEGVHNRPSVTTPAMAPALPASSASSNIGTRLNFLA